MVIWEKKYVTPSGDFTNGKKVLQLDLCKIKNQRLFNAIYPNDYDNTESL